MGEVRGHREVEMHCWLTFGACGLSRHRSVIHLVRVFPRPLMCHYGCNSRILHLRRSLHSVSYGSIVEHEGARDSALRCVDAGGNRGDFLTSRNQLPTSRYLGEPSLAIFWLGFVDHVRVYLLWSKVAWFPRGSTPMRRAFPLWMSEASTCSGK